MATNNDPAYVREDDKIIGEHEYVGKWRLAVAYSANGTICGYATNEGRKKPITLGAYLGDDNTIKVGYEWQCFNVPKAVLDKLQSKLRKSMAKSTAPATVPPE